MNAMTSFTNGNELQEIKKNFGHSIEDITGQVAEVAGELSHKTMSTIKKYPLHTALAAAGVGFVVGALVARK
jgi:ElaB/YqjD/DUF883 family membrane-anchored ribosome-binding protein